VPTDSISSGWGTTVLLGLTIGPYIDAMILVAMHELSHNLCTGKILYDRLISIFVNIPMLFPISEVCGVLIREQ
jgi:hypothetical protein